MCVCVRCIFCVCVCVCVCVFCVCLCVFTCENLPRVLKERKSGSGSSQNNVFNFLHRIDDVHPKPFVQLAFYSMAYLERSEFENIILFGGKMGLFNRDLAYLFADLAKLQPSSVVMVPSICNRVKAAFDCELQARLRTCAKPAADFEKTVLKEFLQSE